MQHKDTIANLTFRFVLIIGIVNLFADFTYEGARSITGPFLATLGASAVVVGFVAGFGEMIGYALRSVTGFFADKTHKYWMFAFIGYFVNMLAVPALALAGSWPVAAALMIAERSGRAFRKPSMDTMLSYAGSTLGHGWVFGLNEALDQAGATIGPLVVACAIYFKGGYRSGFAALLIPALLCLATIVIARVLYPRPQELDQKQAKTPETKGLSRTYWLYVIAGALIAAGFADFALISYHFQKDSVVSAEMIPVFYSVAMATPAIAAPILGKLVDKFGFPVMVVAYGAGALFAPFAFSMTFYGALLGIFLWGIGLAAQDTLFKAKLATIVPADRRASAYGLFDTGFGIAWFIGSAAMGLLYGHSLPALIIMSVVLQLAAIPVLYFAQQRPQVQS